MKKSKQCLKSLWDTVEKSDQCIMGVPEGEKGKGKEIVLNKQ